MKAAGKTGVRMDPGKLGRLGQAGLTLVELMVSIAISMTVLGGAVQVLVVSKGNFVTGRELATLQENARFAMRLLSDEVRMAGYTGCSATPLGYANSIRNSAGIWYLGNTGLRGYEHEAGVNSFPAEFRSDTAADTDAIVVLRGEIAGLDLSGNHNASSATIPVNMAHSYQPGQIMVIVSADCTQVGVFQLTGPTNNGNDATSMNHNQGNANPSPGNCTESLTGNFTCANTAGATVTAYPPGSTIMEMRSDAYYIGSSSTDSSVPALFRERLQLSGTTIGTTSEELVQGVENMQILYGLDNAGGDGLVDMYLKANSESMNWAKVVAVRLVLRMRSITPVYTNDVEHPEFEGIDDTDVSDRFMRQVISTTIQIRNS